MRKLLLLLVLGAVFAVTNPGMEQFQEFAEEHSEELLLRETGNTDLGRFLSRLGGSLAGSFIDRVTERNNYLVFSIYTVDLDADEQGEDEWRFLGVAGQFIELHRPESLQDRGDGR